MMYGGEGEVEKWMSGGETSGSQSRRRRKEEGVPGRGRVVRKSAGSDGNGGKVKEQTGSPWKRESAGRGDGWAANRHKRTTDKGGRERCEMERWRKN